MFNLEFKDYTVNKYQYIGEFHQGLARVQNNKGLWGFINRRGEEVIPCQFKAVKSFNEGLAPVCNEEGKWGYIDKKGKLIIPCQFKDASPFCEEIATVTESYGDPFYDKVYINKQGENIFNKRFEYASSFVNGFGIISWFENEGFRYCYINRKGELSGEYEFCGNFDENGFACVKPVNDRMFGFINRNFEFGKKKKCFIRDNGFGVYPDISEGVILIEENNCFNFYDCEFNIKISIPFDGVSMFKNGVAHVIIGEKIGFVGKDGSTKLFSTKTQYKRIKYFHEDLAAVENIDGLWGFINKKGKEVIPCQFKEVDDFSEGLAGVVDKDNNMYFIDKKGNKKLEKPVIYCSTLEIDGVELDDEKKNGAVVSIEAETEEELNAKKLQVLAVAKKLVIANMTKQIDEEAFSISSPYIRGRKL